MIDFPGGVPYYYRGAHEARHNKEIIFSFKQKQKQLEVALDTN